LFFLCRKKDKEPYGIFPKETFSYSPHPHWFNTVYYPPRFVPCSD
jgi:hypothetical protein